MTDIYSKEKRSEIMSAIRSRGNLATEIKFAGILRKYRVKGWRRHVQMLGTPDFVFQKEKLAVFIDGCFWHGCPKHFSMPKTNTAFWEERITRNKSRDRMVNDQLKTKGWVVLRIWQHELREDSSKIIRKINKYLAR